MNPNIYRVTVTFQSKGKSFIAHFTDTCIVTMNTGEAKKAKALFAAELEKLVGEAKMPLSRASSIEERVAINPTNELILRRPVLAEGEEQDTEECELFFEEEYSGEVPDIMVGLEFHKREVRWCTPKDKEGEYIPLWEFVLRKVSEKLLEEGALTSRDMLNLERAEAKFAKK